MRGEALQASCSFCGQHMGENDIPLVGLHFICRACACAASDSIEGVRTSGWTVVRASTPGAAALGLFCVFCRTELSAAEVLAGVGNYFVCVSCISTATRAR
jgi:hypothetical protein